MDKGELKLPMAYDEKEALKQFTLAGIPWELSLQRHRVQDSGPEEHVGRREQGLDYFGLKLEPKVCNERGREYEVVASVRLHVQTRNETPHSRYAYYGRSAGFLPVTKVGTLIILTSEHHTTQLLISDFHGGVPPRSPLPRGHPVPACLSGG